MAPDLRNVSCYNNTLTTPATFVGILGNFESRPQETNGQLYMQRPSAGELTIEALWLPIARTTCRVNNKFPQVRIRQKKGKKLHTVYLLLIRTETCNGTAPGYIDTRIRRDRSLVKENSLLCVISTTDGRAYAASELYDAYAIAI